MSGFNAERRERHLARCLGSAFLLGSLLLQGCSRAPPTPLEIERRGVLNVVTLNGPTTYYQSAHGPQGVEYRIAAAYATSLGARLHMYAVRDNAAMRAELAAGRADMAAAAITADRSWSGFSIAGGSYQSLPQVLVSRRGRDKPQSIADLKGGRIAVWADGPHELTLAALHHPDAPHLQWLELKHDGDDPLHAVNAGTADYAVMDENAFVYARHQYPDVVAAFTLPDPRPLHWMTAAGALEISASVDSFFASLARGKRLGPLLRESAPETQEFHYEIARRFQVDILERLPQLQPWFEEAQQETGVDWRLLAALAYQESRWNATARSDDGAQGIMMLTDVAAKMVNVTDRNDPRSSILGGARYFVTVRAKVPARIVEPDRTWLALAAYNTGFGHLEDARIVAQSLRKNPDRWADVREALPLLEQERWYLQARNGYARGWEPVRLVDQIQLFLNFLEWGGAAPGAPPSTDGGSTAPQPAEPVQ